MSIVNENLVKKTFEFGQHTISIETGEIARQASASVIVSMGETCVFVSVVANDEAKEDIDFFPLTVEYQEKSYSAGKIPSGSHKREGRPSEREILTARLIDRPIRPLFPDGFYNEVQVVALVLSIDPNVEPDIPAIIGASAALSLSGIPFNGPIGAARVGYIDGEYVLCPTNQQIKNSQMDLVVAGTQNAVLMVESEAKELSEDIMLGAVVFGHEAAKIIVENINQLVEQAGKPAWDWQAKPKNTELDSKLRELVLSRLQDAYRITAKQERTAAIKVLKDEAISAFCEANEDDNNNAEKIIYNKNELEHLFFDLEAEIVRTRILNGEPRIDGRDTRTVRPISIRTGVLPRTHGSGLFTRGETQSLAVATLGTNRDEQIVDALSGEYRDRFMLHYNMPPFATGECGKIGSPKRREIGHGRLAKRALLAVLPSVHEFPYTLRVVSEIMESNGSSSMASVCAGCLALMDAGVPLKSHVAGTAMGLIKEENKFAVLTDILGDEDHLGDMDFKVAGTADGITALQMDIKIQGITKEIMQIALAQAKEARLHILEQMKAAMPTHREDLSPYAPRLYTIRISPEKIRDVIGKGGAVIRAITEETGTIIDIQDNGYITIASMSNESAMIAKQRIEEITADVVIGRVYEGTVLRILDFGAIVQVLPGKDGLLHISQISHARVNRIEDYIQEGQIIRVKVMEIDDRNRIKVSMKAVGENE